PKTRKCLRILLSRAVWPKEIVDSAPIELILSHFFQETTHPFIDALRRWLIASRAGVKYDLCCGANFQRRIEMNQSYGWRQVTLALMVVLMGLSAPFIWAQTLGTAPQLNTAVQGQTGAQPEGAFFNFINWIGNVIAPIGAGGAVFGCIVAFMSGRHMG